MTENQFLIDILVLLGAAIVAVPVFQRLRLGSVLGYLAAGAVIGPWGFGVFDQVEEIRHVAEFGVVFLLFLIGIELNPSRFWHMRRMILGLGSLQVMVTGLLLTGLTLFFGEPLRIALIVGFGLALSSTAFGLQILTERGEIRTQHGRTAFSILLLQDLAVVPLLALVSLLGMDRGLLEGLEMAILEAALAVTGVIIAARFLLTPALRLVATSRNQEVFTAAALFAVLGTAWLMEEVGLSLALGAFLAGLMMADCHYRHQVVADVEPFRGILLGLFFMAVGMSINFGLLINETLLIITLVLGILALKTLILWLLCRMMRVTTADANRVAMLLAQSGEFGFVLFGLAMVGGILSRDLFQLLTLVIALTMVMTPLMTWLSDLLNRRLIGGTRRHEVSTEHLDEALPHVILAGFGRIGRRVATVLRAGKVPYLAIDSNPDQVHEGRRLGFNVFYGDASQADVLRAAGASEAGVIVCSLDEPDATVNLVRILREQYPSVPIHVRGRDRQHCAELLAAGATMAISETLEASLQMSAGVLNTMGVFEEEVGLLLEGMRREYYMEERRRREETSTTT